MRDDDFEQTRLLIEELCCDLCRFKHATEEGLPMGAVRIDRELLLVPGTAPMADAVAPREADLFSYKRRVSD